MPQAKKQPPLDTFLNGTAKASVWSNKTKNGGEMLKVTFENIYKDENGNWTSNHSFSISQLPNVAASALEARQFALRLEHEQRAENPPALTDAQSK